MSDVPNACAGPFGFVYDFYIEREWLSRVIGRLVWGIDVGPFYASMQAIGGLGEGATILDVPCGGGVALRALRPEQDVRYLAGDLSPKMLARTKKRAARRSLHQVETVVADMCALPFEDQCAELCLSFSGLHTVSKPEQAVCEIVRCINPGGQLVGSTFLRDGTRRQKRIFAVGERRGFPAPDFTCEDLRTWLRDAGIDQPVVEPDRGFAVFGGHKLGP
jgi:SAM-dependent methyltransferase